MDTKKSGLHGMSILRSEADDFLSKGRDSFALPQTNAQGDFSQGKFLNIDGVKALDLTRLDYLSLGSRSEVRDIMIDCIRQYDISCPASQMVMRSGSTDRLERALADFHGMESSFVFLSGYAANEDLMQALGMRLRIGHLQGYVRATGMGSATREIPTVFFVDSESHFSLQHGIRVAKGQSLKTQCRSHSFESGDYEALEGLLDRSMEQMGEQVFRVIVTDALSSISGKVFDIARLCRIAERFDCMLYVDEAHSVGSMGPGGRGITSSMPEFQYYRDRIFLMGTLTKTISQLGGYVTMSGVDNALLRACCPHYIFSAPVPPWMAEATIRVLNLIGGDYGEEARNNLSTRSKHMRERLVSLGFDTLGSNSHIIPIFIGDEARAKSIKLEMLKSGFLASLFIYPAVQKSNALVRFSLTSDVEMDEIDAIVDCFVAAAKRY